MVPRIQSQVNGPREVPTPRRRDILSTFHYYREPEDGSPPAPYYLNQPQTPDRQPFPQELLVHDIRGTEHQYTLDTTGFQVVHHESEENDFLDDEQIQKIYYPEVEEILKKATEASRIFIFEHTTRRLPFDSSRPIIPQPESNNSLDEPVPAPSRAFQSLRGPVHTVHVDQSHTYALELVSKYLPAEAAILLKGRVQIINVWRPIKTVYKDPLGILCADTVLETELVPITLVYPDKTVGTFAVRPRMDGGEGGHRWCYLNGQTPEEVLLIKNFDSKTDGRVRRTPHSSFADKEFEGAETRESIEVRALVFHPDDGE